MALLPESNAFLRIPRVLRKLETGAIIVLLLLNRPFSTKKQN
jgi:hypothetical protein